MNIYIRYFNDEVLVQTVEEALDFISGIQGFVLTPQFEDDFRQYIDSSMPYPKRYKVRARVYFIVIKTMAASLEEFKANGKGGGELPEDYPAADDPVHRDFLRPKDQIRLRLNDELPGWYEGEVNFKRVVINPQTGKFDYKDTSFIARLKARSAQDCYNRIIDHLRNRPDIDPRSQFPSPKGKNYRYTYLGFKPYAELEV